MTPTPLPEGQYFDELLGEQGDFNPFTDRGWQTLAKQFERLAEESHLVRLLDVGCGTGHSHDIYAKRARRYVGLDLSATAVRTAARHRPALAWLQGDGANLPFGNHTFDVVAFSSVLHHMPDMRRALVEARRVLVPGGLVFAFDPNLLHPAMFLFRHPKSPLYRPEGVSPHERPLLPSAVLAALRDAGFASIGQRCQSDIPYRYVGPRFLQRGLRAYNAIDRLWEFSGAGRWMGSFVVTWGRVPG